MSTRCLPTRTFSARQCAVRHEHHQRAGAGTSLALAHGATCIEHRVHSSQLLLDNSPSWRCGAGCGLLRGHAISTHHTARSAGDRRSQRLQGGRRAASPRATPRWRWAWALPGSNGFRSRRSTTLNAIVLLLLIAVLAFLLTGPWQLRNWQLNNEKGMPIAISTSALATNPANTQ
jgi:hypothetical protein